MRVRLCELASALDLADHERDEQRQREHREREAVCQDHRFTSLFQGSATEVQIRPCELRARITPASRSGRETYHRASVHAHGTAKPRQAEACRG